MKEKSTNELTQTIINSPHTADLLNYTNTIANENKLTFQKYMNEKLLEKGLCAADVIRNSQIQRNYGYQILNGQKQPGRDKILALCLAASFSLDETQKALTLAGEGVLYPRKVRDSVIIFCCDKHKSVIEANELLYQTNQKLL